MHQNSGFIKTTKTRQERQPQQGQKMGQERREKAKAWERTNKRAQTL